jgi:hypothetical protein
MTAWTMGHTPRFSATVCGAPCFDLESMYGTSDISHAWGPYQLGGNPHDASEAFAAHSCSTFAHRATTPTLIIHGEGDNRCPIGQGKRMFVTLKQAGCEVEFARYPGGAHTFLRVGRHDACFNSVSLYGTADAGVLGNETPFSLAIRRHLAAQDFDPRPDLGVRGVRPLPFVYVFGRADFALSYFGANVYPENVSVGLEESPIDGWVTGKLVMQTREDDDRNTYLAIVVELGPGVTADANKTVVIGDSILRNLVRLNSEFANDVPPERQLPRIELAEHADPDYFPIGVKHRYARR